MRRPRRVEVEIGKTVKHHRSYSVIIPKRFIEWIEDELGHIPKYWKIQYVRDDNEALKNPCSFIILVPLDIERAEPGGGQKTILDRLIEILNRPIISWGGEE